MNFGDLIDKFADVKARKKKIFMKLTLKRFFKYKLNILHFFTASFVLFKPKTRDTYNVFLIIYYILAGVDLK